MITHPEHHFGQSTRRNPTRRARPRTPAVVTRTRSSVLRSDSGSPSIDSPNLEEQHSIRDASYQSPIQLPAAIPKAILSVQSDDNFVTVFTNIQIFRLQKIDSSSEEYCADVGMTFIWIDPKLVNQIHGNYYSTHPAIVKQSMLKDVGEVNLWPEHLKIGENVFDPAWKILNSSEVNIVKSITTIMDANIGKVHNFVHVRATIDQYLDLHDFPFDKQKLQFRLQSEHPTQCMKFCKFSDRDPKIFAAATSEWQFKHPTLPQIKLINSLEGPAASGVVYASITAEFYALRKPEWYMWNVVFTSFAIVLSSFALFFLDEENKGDRLTLLFTTWLMLISLKFIISDRLPKISYFSTLDYYITFTYIIMVLLICHVCTNTKDKSNYFTISTAKEPDMFVLYSLIWFAVNIVVVIHYHRANGWEVWDRRLKYLGFRKQ